MPATPEAHSPYALFDEVKRAREVLVLTYTASLEFFERFALSDARALGALVTVISDATMVRADPMIVRRAGVQYLDARAVCPDGTAFHPKLLVIVGDGQARVAIGSGNLTMAGWHGNAETWTILRADNDGGPDTLRDVAAFLRSLAGSQIDLSAGAHAPLARVADHLDALPADQSGPRLLHSLTDPIADQLPQPAGPVDELMLHAPFHDRRLDGINDLLDRLQPARWTVYVRSDTVVDGLTLQELANARGGRIAWITRRPQRDDGTTRRDERYWHGKVAQWRTSDGETWALTGSPNLSRPALLRKIGDGGNCELAVLSSIDHDLTPVEGEPPPDGPRSLCGPTPHREGHRGPMLLSAFASAGTVKVELHKPLDVPGEFQRYDTTGDLWTAAASASAGADHYDLDIAAAPIGRALRIRTETGLISNEVFVADPARLTRRQVHAIGKVRGSPGDVVRDGLGNQLLADIDELRGHLLTVGATVSVQGPTDEDEQAGEGGVDALPPARPAPGQTLEDFLEACDPVLGQRMTEFALVLPALPGVGAALDDDFGTLDSDTDEGDKDKEGLTGDPPPTTIRHQLARASPSERRRYRGFVERLVKRAPGYPMVVRTLTLRTLMHSIAARLWSDEEWPELLAAAVRALAAGGDEPRPEEQRAAASLAAVGLAQLRTDVPRMSEQDERQMRYRSTAHAVAVLLADRDEEQIELLALDLPGGLAGPAGVLATEQAVEEALHPPRGIDRAVRLLSEDEEIAAHAEGGATIVIDDPLEGLPEPTMILALRLADESGPVFARGVTAEGRTVQAAWCAPWLAVEKIGKAGLPYGRAWQLQARQTLRMIDRAEMPRADLHWAAGSERPLQVSDLLALAENDM